MKLKKFNENFDDDNWDEDEIQPEKKLHDDIFGGDKWKDDDIDKSSIRQLDEYTDEEKIEKFDELYESAKDMLEKFRDSDRGEPDEDEPNYTWESVMNLLAKDKRKFWEYYRTLY